MEQLYLGTIGLSAIGTDPKDAAAKCFDHLNHNLTEVILTVYDSKSQVRRKFKQDQHGNVLEIVTQPAPPEVK